MKARVKCKLCGNQIDYSKSNIPKQYCGRSCASKSKAKNKEGNMIRLTDTKGNWDIYLNERGYTESIAIVEGCGSTIYGPMTHFMKNLSLGYIDLDHLTEQGREIAIKEANARNYKIKGLNI